MNLTEVKTLAESLMDAWLVNRSQWRFDWLTSTRRLGACNYRKSTIYLNEDWVLAATEKDLPEIKDTILHEIAHAMAGSGAGHGRMWRLACLTVGANPQCTADNELFKEVSAKNAKYMAVCPTCGHKYYRSRLTRNSNRAHCAICSRRYGFKDENKLTYRMNY